MKSLQINASARREDSSSTQLATAIVERLKAVDPDTRVTVRDLAATPHSMLDEAALAALFTPADRRTPGQARRVVLDDALIADLQSHDTLVLGVPMYNFGIPVQLKNWTDAVARAGVTFRYTETGPEGLLMGKKVYLGLTRGGLNRDTEKDAQVPYLRNVLAFLGVTDLSFIYAEGLAMGPEAALKGFAQAEADIEAAFACSPS